MLSLDAPVQEQKTAIQVPLTKVENEEEWWDKGIFYPKAAALLHVEQLIANE